MKKSFKVYIHTNKINNKKYIGITSIDISKRWGSNGNGYKTQIFYKAIQKYGWDNFEHEIIFENISEMEAKEIEINLIDRFKTTNKKFGYNQTCGGDLISEKTRNRISKSNRERVISEETRTKMSISSKGKLHTEESRKKMSEAKKGYIRSQESKIKQSLNHADVSAKNNPMYGKRFTDEHKAKIKEALKGKMSGNDNPMFGRKRNGELAGNRKKVVQLSLNGDFIKEYINITEAHKETGAIRQHISKCCTGERKTTGGYKWEYALTE